MSQSGLRPVFEQASPEESDATDDDDARTTRQSSDAPGESGGLRVAGDSVAFLLLSLLLLLWLFVQEGQSELCNLIIYMKNSMDSYFQFILEGCPRYFLTGLTAAAVLHSLSAEIIRNS